MRRIQRKTRNSSNMVYNSVEVIYFWWQINFKFLCYLISICTIQGFFAFEVKVSNTKV